jgi:hypothetical protein
VVNEGEDLPKIPEKARISVELVGSSDWVSKAKKTLKGQCSIKTKITDKGKFESRKAGNSLQDFITNHYQLPSGMVKERLVEFMKELGLV